MFPAKSVKYIKMLNLVHVETKIGLHNWTIKQDKGVPF